MKELGSKVLKTERLTLRLFRADDAEVCYQNWMTDPAVTKYLTWTPHEDIAFTRALLAAWEEEAKKPDVFHWAIVKEGEVIGFGGEPRQAHGLRRPRLLPLPPLLGAGHHDGSARLRQGLSLCRVRALPPRGVSCEGERRLGQGDGKVRVCVRGHRAEGVEAHRDGRAVRSCPPRHFAGRVGAKVKRFAGAWKKRTAAAVDELTKMRRLLPSALQTPPSPREARE